MKLDKSFFTASATTLAPKLLGKFICRNINGSIIKAKITETECYFGEEDTACHAAKGRTPRTEVMYSEGGVAYVYLCYGLHFLFNIVTGKEGHPEGVLIRGVEGIKGPGRVTKFLEIDKSLNAENLATSSRLWIENGGETPQFTTSKRVGIDYATPNDRDKLWNFKLKP